MLRFSLLALLGAVLVISIGCAALVSGSELWARTVVTATVLALLVATVGAFYLPARTRAFAGGFAICGWAYLAVAFGPWLEAVKPQLAATVAVNRLQAALRPNDPGPQGGGANVVWSVALASGQASTAPAMLYSGPTVAIPYVENFMLIGQSLWAILLAFCGGVLAKFFDGRKRQDATAVPGR